MTTEARNLHSLVQAVRFALRRGASFMSSAIRSYPKPRETPLPTQAARAARQAYAARPATSAIATTAARVALSLFFMAGLAGLFTTLIEATLR